MKISLIGGFEVDVNGVNDYNIALDNDVVDNKRPVNTTIKNNKVKIKIENIVKRIPNTLMFGLKPFFALDTVLIIKFKPSIARYSHCNGIMTSSHQANAFTVSNPSDGGQSRRIKSYSFSISFNAFFKKDSLLSSSTNSIASPATSSEPGIR